MQVVVETAQFSRQAEKLFSEDEKMDVIGFLASHPWLGDEIPDTGGVRKLRVPASGRGKRGGGSRQGDQERSAEEQKMSKFGDELIAAMNEALDHARGRKKLKTHRMAAEPVNIKAVRARLRLTQDEMAALLGVSASGYRKWEQGVRRPQGAARTLLKIMAREPQSVLRALGGDRAA